MIEEIMKQKTWHKKDKRYNPDKMVHPSNGEAWTYFDRIHHEKAREACNVRVALATDGFNTYGLLAARTLVGPSSLSPSIPSCLVCKAALRFIWLQKGGKFSAFDKHRQFLPLDHPFRQDIKNFMKGVIVIDPPPQMMTDAEIHAQIDALKWNKKEGHFTGYGQEHMWTQKSGLTRLRYFDDLLPHNIDVMHTEKNVAEALWATLMNTEESKDNPNARVDLATLCDRPKQEMRPPRGDKKWTRPKADFMLSRE
jgi:hypothetical protein